MNDRTWRIVEAAAVHAVQQAVGTAFEKVKARLDTTADLRKRVESLEADMAQVRKRGNR